MTRLGVGGIVRGWVAVDHAWTLFLATMSRIAPDVVFELRDSILPLYTAAFEEWHSAMVVGEFAHLYPRLTGRLRAEWFLEDMLKLCDSVQFSTDDSPLREKEEVLAAADRWLVDWHLSLAWDYGALLSRALHQLATWQTEPATACPACPWPHSQGSCEHGQYLLWPDHAGADLYWGFGAVGERWTAHISCVDADARRFTFEHEGWDFATSTRSEAEAAMLKAYKRQVKDHHDALEAACTTAGGFVHSTVRPSILTHFEWLVRYQVLEEEWPDIAATATRELAGCD